MWQIPAPGSAETVPSQQPAHGAGSGSSFGLITLLLITTTSSTIYILTPPVPSLSTEQERCTERISTFNQQNNGGNALGVLYVCPVVRTKHWWTFMPQYIKVTIKQNVCMFAHIHLEKYSSTEAFTGNQDGQGVARMNSKALFMVIIFVGFSSSSSPWNWVVVRIGIKRLTRWFLQ